MQLDHVDHSNGCFLVETFAGFTIMQVSMTIHWDRCLFAIFPDLFSCSTIKYWSREFHTEFLSGPSEYSFINLSQVHTTRYTQRVQYNVNRRSIFQEWHVFCTNDLRNNSFVSVTTGHLISHFQFAFNSQVHFSELQHASR